MIMDKGKAGRTDTLGSWPRSSRNVVRRKSLARVPEKAIHRNSKELANTQYTFLNHKTVSTILGLTVENYSYNFGYF